MERLRLVIGNRRLSSWSLRAWLVLRKSGLAFEEAFIPLDRTDTRRRLTALSPGGTVPVLETPEATVWDSLAIAEWAAERVPALWPEHQAQRALARAVTASMHSGFTALRATCPMDLQRAPRAIALDDATRADITAVQSLWNAAGSLDGPFLFGRWCIADAFFTPVATRFASYDIPLHADAQDYCDALLGDEDYRLWHDAAAAETF